jgi:Tfp pilus assembly protein PilO
MTTSYKRIAAVTAAAALAVVLVWYLALFHPESQKLTQAHRAHAAAEQTLAQLTAQTAQLRLLQRKIPADTQRLQILKAAVPDSPDLHGALDQLQAAATQCGVALGTLSPSQPTTATSGSTQTPGPPSVTLTLAAQGSYAQLTQFITEVTRESRAFVVDRLSLSGSGNKLSANLTMRIFYAGTPTP